MTNGNIASWISALATVIGVLIAIKELNLWKKETREKEIFKINKKCIVTINKFYNLLKNHELIHDEEKTRIQLEEIKDSFDEVLYEYNLVQKIKNKDTELKNKLLYFKLLLEKYVTEKVEPSDNWLGIKVYYEKFWDDYTPSQDDEGEIIETDEYKELSTKLKHAKELCENNINKFYN